MKPINMTKIYSQYKGKWVALKSSTDTTVIASSKTLEGTLAKAQRKGIKNPFMAQIPKEVLPIIGLKKLSIE